MNGSVFHHWRKRMLFNNPSEVWNKISLKKTLSTLVDREEKLNVNENISNKKFAMKEECEKPKQKLNFQSLLNYGKRKISIEIVPASAGKRIKASVDIKLMKEELKQLEDPPATPWEKQISSARLPYSFYDVPCKTLAQNLLGKVLVRKLENGTILKGRIVETESYLGVEDKASHTYQGKVTPRNTPMYMPPGTIYVYFTYGMYHCFNISSQEAEKLVLIKRVEPLVGLEYMELLRNTYKKQNTEGKDMNKTIKKYKSRDLCSRPTEICSAFLIEIDEFDRKNICTIDNLWIDEKKGSAVLIRALEPLEGIELMTENRSWKPKAKEPKKLMKNLKIHELCNGPSKICISLQLTKQHSKYSLCDWKELWIEDDGKQEEFKIVECARIGIESAGEEWANKPLRYYVYGHKCVSKRDKKAESVFQ